MEGAAIQGDGPPWCFRGFSLTFDALPGISRPGTGLELKETAELASGSLHIYRRCSHSPQKQVGAGRLRQAGPGLLSLLPTSLPAIAAVIGSAPQTQNGRGP